ncbi:thioredoxin-dependent thiol peroxidase [Paenibacillus phoenicis]|uniref:thioredoxin-dependent peroxiredoxin n=1 Tax=Paenibacillus phoenicis TaxID=554117 RepID=A0ABU5PRA1_9BACL|nr:thioredoxin-dependent thiol peroxidase [Paenibacillus phoenicis]MEA3572468.1 thioredoxin-dependent thiol peroxidase [Paenibacillus phoenicis]
MSEQTQQVQIGQHVPDFQLPAANGEEISLSQFRGRKVVLYFYPKDSTPACTQEACDFRDLAQAYGEYGAVVLGISGDSVKSHARFAMKQGLNFPLLSDESHEVCRMFGVWQLKKMYGREYEGIVRSTFLIDEEGKLLREWRGVRVKGHAEEVLALLQGRYFR